MPFRTRADALRLGLPEGYRAFDYWHESEKGFGVRVRSSGRRSYVARYQANGKDVKKVLGDVAVLSFDDARNQVRDLVRVARAKRDGSRLVPTLQDVYEAHLAQATRARPLAAATLADYKKRWKYLSAWHGYRLDAITPEMLESRYVALTGPHGRAQAQGVFRLLSVLFRRAVRRGDLAANPLLSLDLGLWQRGPVRTGVVSRSVLPAFWQLVQLLGGLQRDYVLVCLFTGWRRSLVDAMSWDRVSLENRTYSIRADDAGNKAKVAFTYPLPDWLVEHVLLPRWQFRRGSPWVLPSDRRPGQPVRAIRAAFARISSCSGTLLSPHDLRRTYASVAEVTVGLSVTSRLLLHSAYSDVRRELAVTAGYVVHSDDELRVANNSVAAAILQYAGVVKYVPPNSEEKELIRP